MSVRSYCLAIFLALGLTACAATEFQPNDTDTNGRAIYNYPGGG